MAKSKAKGKTGKKPASEAVKAPEVVRLITAKKLKSLLGESDSARVQVGDINGSLREGIAYAIEHDHLHKGAFAKLKSWWKMKGSPEKLAHEWDVFMAYMDASGLMKTIESVQQLPLGEGDEAEAEPDEGAADNVTLMPQAAE